MRAIWKREMQNYYLTPIGYVFMGIFLLLGGLMFFLGNVMSMTPSVATLLGNLNYIFMLTVPILTMRLFSEEKRTKTDQLLITSPRGQIHGSGICRGDYHLLYAAVCVFAQTVYEQYVSGGHRL